MRTILGLALGVSQVVLGLVMIVTPRAFYDGFPSVPGTGPFNPHFVRDIGCAFLVAGSALAWAVADARAWAAGVAGASFLALHALVHVWDGLAGRERLEHLAFDLPVLLGLAALAFWVVAPGWGGRRDRKGAPGADVADPAAARRLRTDV